MDIAIEMLIPIVGALFLGMWLQNEYGMSPLWTVLLAVLGMAAGIWIVYKRTALRRQQYLKDHPEEALAEKQFRERAASEDFNPRPWEDKDPEQDNDDKDDGYGILS